MKNANQEIVIDTSAILTTFKFNLKCKLCCTASPYQDNPQHFPLNRLNSCIKRYFEVVKYIRKLSFGGGEPTLRQDLPDLIDATMKYSEQFDIFEIITNGTIIPSENFFCTLEKYKHKMYIMIDNYGAISRNASKLSKILEQKGIQHSVRKYHGKDAHFGGWVDLGDYSHKHSSKEASELYRACVISNQPKRRTGKYRPIANEDEMLAIPYIAMTDGLLHRCARSYSTMQAGSVSKESNNFVNIMAPEKSIIEIRSEIQKLMNQEYITACEYCNGFSQNAVRYKPAEQL